MWIELAPVSGPADHNAPLRGAFHVSGASNERSANAKTCSALP
jgi:hypothetical protein